MLRARFSSKGSRLAFIHSKKPTQAFFVYIQFSTLVIALATGVTLLVNAQHLRVPAIVPLLLGGILLGPEVSGLIDPAI